MLLPGELDEAQWAERSTFLFVCQIIFCLSCSSHLGHRTAEQMPLCGDKAGAGTNRQRVGLLFLAPVLTRD